MPPIEAFGPALAIGVILFVMLWFALGTQRNIRKGNEVLAWLQGGLPLLGRKTTLRWLGSSAVELGIVDPAPPFREATVVVVLEPRDVSLLWAFARARGRRDFMIVRASLARPPRASVDVRDPRGWTGKPDADEGAWRPVAWAADALALVGASGNDVDAATSAVAAAWRGLSETSDGVWRVTVQPVVPHLEVHLRPPARAGVRADRVLTPIRELAVSLERR